MYYNQQLIIEWLCTLFVHFIILCFYIISIFYEKKNVYKVQVVGMPRGRGARSNNNDHSSEDRVV